MFQYLIQQFICRVNYPANKLLGILYSLAIIFIFTSHSYAQTILNGNFQNTTFPQGFSLIGNGIDSSTKMPDVFTWSKGWSYGKGKGLLFGKFPDWTTKNHPTHNNANNYFACLLNNFTGDDNDMINPTGSGFNDRMALKLSQPLKIGTVYKLKYVSAIGVFATDGKDNDSSYTRRHLPMIARIGLNSNPNGPGDSIGISQVYYKDNEWQAFSLQFKATSAATYITLLGLNKNNPNHRIVFQAIGKNCGYPAGHECNWNNHSYTCFDNFELEEVCSIALGKDTAICQDNTLVLKSNANNGNLINTKYTWSTGDTTANIIITQAGKYWVSMSQNDCIAKDTIQVNIISKISNFLPQDTLLCPNDSLLLAPKIIGKYMWQNNTINNAFWIYKAGLYSVKITDSFCIHTDSILVNYETKPILDIPDFAIRCNDSILTLNTKLVNAKWHNTNGNIFSQTGRLIYQVKQKQTLFISSGLKCPWVDSIYLDIENCLPLEKYIFIPNAFTPNDDGTNEMYNPQMAGWQRKQLEIYNRWGELIFSTNEFSNGWDGKYQNNLVQEGVYVVRITFKALDNDTGTLPYYYYTGTVQVLR